MEWRGVLPIPSLYRSPGKTFFKDFCDKGDVDWEDIHIRNYKCTVETQLRSFYFELFHKAIAFNSFLHKIGRKNFPLCFFCKKKKKCSETVVHVFCECDKVKPIWSELCRMLNNKLHAEYQLDNFEFMFGVAKWHVVIIVIFVL